MQNDISYLNQLLRQGHCCSAAIVAVGLKHIGSENPELIGAVRGLCGGLGSNLICGALSGAACMMTLLNPESRTEGGLAELAEWFEYVYGEKYGGINCRDILADKLVKSMICPKIVEETYKRAKQILIDNGYIFAEEGSQVWLTE